MAIDHGGRDITLIAGEDLSNYQYHFVHQESDTGATLLDSATEFPIGVLQNAPASGEAAVIRVEGISKLKMNAAVTIGLPIKAEYVGAVDNGKGDDADTDLDLVRGHVVQTAGAEDDVGSILLTCYVLSK